jgi:PAS domain-containing protein
MNELLLSSETILDSLSEGVYVCDRDRRIVFWSKSAERTTGWQSEDVLGKRCLEDILYKEKTVRLETGDSILLLSDGAIEIQNAKNEWLGNERFTRILKSLDYPRKKLSMDSLEEELLKFSNDIRLQDDITIIEVRFTGQSANS